LAVYTPCISYLGNAYEVLMGRPAAKRSLGTPQRRWEDIIRRDVREIG